MKSHLAFFDYDSQQASNCGEVLDIEFSSAALEWKGVVLEKGRSPHFYPTNVYTPYFYFALALDEELNWNAQTDSGITALKTQTNEIWINPPHTPFTHQIDQPCHFVILAIEEQTFLEHCPLNVDGLKLNFLNNYNVLDEVIHGIIELFMLELRNKGRNGVSHLHGLLRLLSGHYIQNYSNYRDLINAQQSASKFTQHQVDKVDEYMTENLGEPITVDDLADLLGCSKYYFLREFKKLLGVTPYQYLLNKRVEQAKLALNSPNANIGAISLDLGFNDQSHFTRAFKNHVGMTPGQYIKQNNV